MALTEKDVRYVAELAHLDLSEEEVRTFQPQLVSILDYVQKLNQLDTARIEPMAQVITPGAAAPALRSDQVVPSLPQETAMAAAPEKRASLFRVPAVIERD